jgi:uncharacterized protein (TIGR02996 family)
MPPAEQEQLLGAIRAQPDDDTARLAYADWLDENGDAERAEFVRVQCRLAALGHGPLWPHGDSEQLAYGVTGEAVALVRRQAALWEENRGAWLGELPSLPGSVVMFHRGFAAAVVVEHPGGLVRNGERLLASAPVTRVVFRGCLPEAIEVCVGRLWFGEVRSLAVGWAASGGNGNHVAQILAECGHLTRLQDLSLFNATLTNPGAHEISAAPFVKQLAKLDLAGNRVRDSGALSVANALDADRLVVFDLSGNPLTDSLRANLRRRFGDRVCVEGGEGAE